MKTVNNTPKNQNTTANVVTAASSAASSAIGATAGIVGAELVMPAKAAAQTVQSPVAGNHTSHRQEEPAANHQTHTIPEKPIAHPEEVPAEADAELQDDGLLVDPADPVIDVIEYETLQGEGGQQVDLAVVAVDGQEIGFFDVDQDGFADLVAMDVNGDGTITEEEIEDVSLSGISMDQMHNQFLAQNDPSLEGPDYVNDGDVESYLA